MEWEQWVSDCVTKKYVLRLVGGTVMRLGSCDCRSHDYKGKTYDSRNDWKK